MYRINYGNGQVSRTFKTKSEAARELAALSCAFARIQRYAAGTADDPGCWVGVRS